VALPTTNLGEFICYRASSYSFPLWGRVPNREAARFNRQGSHAQYLCLHPLGPMSEKLRALERAQSGASIVYQVTNADIDRVRHRVWALRLNLDGVFVLDFMSCLLVGLSAADLVDDDHGACQAAGETFGSNPNEPWAWVYPSASLPGTRNVVIFGPRYLRTYDSVPTRVGIPGSPLGDDTQAMRETLSLMRHLGQPHSGLQAFQRGEPTARLAQPVVFGL
jgi:hypothetical protein